MLPLLDEATLEPLRRRELFWDVSLASLDWGVHADWVMARVLEYGTVDDLRRVRHAYGDARIRGVLASHRSLPPHIRDFWNRYWPEEAPMQEQTLSPATALVVRQYGTTLCPAGFFLAGGTAVALYCGHRRSEDLDFLTSRPFEAAAIAADLARAADSVIIDAVSEGTVHGRVDGVRVSYLHQRGIPVMAGDAVDTIPVASLDSLMALKCNAVAGRGERKDFLDVFALAREAGGLRPVLETALTLAPNLNRLHLLRSLTYFTDAEASPMPEMLMDWSWEAVRRMFETEVAAILRHDLRPPSPSL